MGSVASAIPAVTFGSGGVSRASVRGVPRGSGPIASTCGSAPGALDRSASAGTVPGTICKLRTDAA